MLWLLVAVVAISVLIYLLGSGQAKPDRLGIKITRQGKRVYEPIPDEPSERVPNWLMAVYVIIALGLLFLPAHYYLNQN